MGAAAAVARRLWHIAAEKAILGMGNAFGMSLELGSFGFDENLKQSESRLNCQVEDSIFPRGKMEILLNF